MANQAGTPAPQSGYYWCSVCKTPAKFEAGQTLPACKNKCGRGALGVRPGGGGALRDE